MATPYVSQHSRTQQSGTADWRDDLDMLRHTDKGDLLVLGDGGESPEFQTDSIYKRNHGIAQLARAIVDAAYTVLVPQKPMTREELRQVLEKHGLQEARTWIYGSVLPRALLNRSLKIQVHLPLPGDRTPDWFDVRFAEKLDPVTLPGYSCFTTEKLDNASMLLLDEYEDIRLKDPGAASGEEQTVIRHRAGLDRFLDEMGEKYQDQGGFESYLNEFGYVVEANLRELESWSYTLTSTPGHSFTSIGRLVESTVEQPDGSNLIEYGGTSVVTILGRSQRFGEIDLPPQIAIDDPLRVGEDQLSLTVDDAVIRVAERYIEALNDWEQDGIVRTRANVDVLKGTLVHRNGRQEGVVAAVEDSARAGGASPAELLAARHLLASNDCDYVVISSRHVFDADDCAAYRKHVGQSANGLILWDGVDASWGDKYVMFCTF